MFKINDITIFMCYPSIGTAGPHSNTMQLGYSDMVSYVQTGFYFAKEQS
jgi:hypothetical protein